MPRKGPEGGGSKFELHGNEFGLCQKSVTGCLPADRQSALPCSPTSLVLTEKGIWGICNMQLHYIAASLPELTQGPPPAC